MFEIRQDKEKYLTISVKTLDEITNAMVKEPSFGKLELMLLLRIASFSWVQNGSRNHCIKSIGVFQQEFERSRQTIERSLKKLKRLGYIKHVYRVMMKGGKEQTTTSWKESRKWNQQGGKTLHANYQVTVEGMGDKIRLLSKTDSGRVIKTGRLLSKSNSGHGKKHGPKHTRKHEKPNMKNMRTTING